MVCRFDNRQGLKYKYARQNPALFSSLHWKMMLYKPIASSSKSRVSNDHTLFVKEKDISDSSVGFSSQSKEHPSCWSDATDAAVSWLCGLSVTWRPGVALQHLCYWYHSLSHFSCLGEAQASKFGPTGPAPLSSALNINTCLRGPVNTWYRGEAVKERAHISHVDEDGKWGNGKEERNKC